MTWVNVVATGVDENRFVNRTEKVMSTGNLLYLLMCIGMFAGFAVVLAYESWQQSRLGPDMIGSVPEDDRTLDQSHGHAVHA